MKTETLDALQAVADLLGNEVTVASIPGRETVRIVGNRLLELSAVPDKAEGWRGAFQMMRRTGIINAEQQQILDDAYQRGAPLRKEVEQWMRANGRAAVVDSFDWNNRQAQVWGFQYYMEKKSRPRGAVERIFDYAKRAYYRVRHLAMNLGHESAEDIMYKAAEGILRRQHQKAAAAASQEYYVVNAPNATEAEEKGLGKYKKTCRQKGEPCKGVLGVSAKK
ncbi:hypothetical protein, partial [Thiolapillus sp.]|uniref:hypothetical protein n=1 Tax=Thiolapillus sp. TaxID=2017437 RepID=UPI0025F3A420